MAERYTCHLLTEVRAYATFLRRFVYSKDRPCQGGYYHNARELIEWSSMGDQALYPPPSHEASDEQRTDHRWPKRCETCGYKFLREDTWQIFRERLWVRDGGGEYLTVSEAKPGDLYHADWLPTDVAGQNSPDGKTYILMIPGWQWAIDSRVRSVPLSTRSGEAPRFTVTGSFTHNGVTWTLRDGILYGDDDAP